MGRNLLRHASLNLYNHFDTHETQHHDTIFNHRIDILPYRYVLQIPTVCVRTCVCTSALLWGCAYMWVWICVCVGVCVCVCVHACGVCVYTV